MAPTKAKSELIFLFYFFLLSKLIFFAEKKNDDEDRSENRDCNQSDVSESEEEEEEISEEEEDGDYSPTEGEEEEEAPTEDEEEEEALILPTKALPTKRKRTVPKAKTVEATPPPPPPAKKAEAAPPPPAKKPRAKKTSPAVRKVNVGKKKPAVKASTPTANAAVADAVVDAVVEDTEEEKKKKKEQEHKEKLEKAILLKKRPSFKIRDVSRPTANFTRDKFLIGDRYAVQIEDVAILGKNGVCFSSVCLQFIRDPPEPNENNAKVFKMGIPIKFLYSLQDTINLIADSGKRDGAILD